MQPRQPQDSWLQKTAFGLFLFSTRLFGCGAADEAVDGLVQVGQKAMASPKESNKASKRLR